MQYGAQGVPLLRLPEDPNVTKKKTLADLVQFSHGWGIFLNNNFSKHVVMPGDSWMASMVVTSGGLTSQKGGAARVDVVSGLHEGLSCWRCFWSLL